MSQVFPMVSNSPPPLDNNIAFKSFDDCDDDFGHFTGEDSSAQSDPIPSNTQHFENSEDFSDIEKSNEKIKIEQSIFKPVLRTLDLNTASDLKNVSECGSPVNVGLVINNVEYDNTTNSWEKRFSQADSGLCSTDVSPGPRSDEMSESCDKSNTCSTDGEEPFADFCTEDSENLATTTTDSRQQYDIVNCDQKGQNYNDDSGVENRTGEISKSPGSVCDKLNDENILMVAVTNIEDQSNKEKDKWADISSAESNKVSCVGSPNVTEILKNEQICERIVENDRLSGSPDRLVSMSELVSSDEDSPTDKSEFSSHADTNNHDQNKINTCKNVNIPDSENVQCVPDSSRDESGVDGNQISSEYSNPQVIQNSHSNDDLHSSSPNANGAWSDENISDIPICDDTVSRSEILSFVTDGETEQSSTSEKQSLESQTPFTSGQSGDNVDEMSEQGSEEDFTDFSSASLPPISGSSGNKYVESTQNASECIEDDHIVKNLDLSDTKVELISGDLDKNTGSESEDCPDGNDEEREEFGRRRLYSEDLQLDLPRATCEPGEGEHEMGWAAFTNISGLASKNDEEIEKKPSCGEIASDSQLVAPSDVEAEDDDEDWAQFDACTEQRTAPAHQNVLTAPGSSTRNKNLHSASISNKLEILVLTCFCCDESCTSDHNRQMLDKNMDTAQQSILPKLTLAQILPRDRKQLELWGRLKDLDNTRAFAYQWPESQSNSNMYRTLKIDIRNILIGHKKQLIPVYATHLTLLEPTKGPALGRKELPLVETLNVASSSNKQMPEVKFDWGGSGLTNPLEASNKSLNLDFLVTQETEKANKTKALQSEFLDVDPTPAKFNIQPLENILANLKTTAVKTPTKDENLSEEAAKIIDKMPDLLFMQTKVLMFPLKQS